MSDHTTRESSVKFCTKCGETKPLKQFSRNRSRKDGLQSECKACKAEHRRAYYAANRERLDEVHGVWAKENPEKVAEYNRAWREANPEKRAEIHARTRAKYPDRYAARDAVNHAVRAGAMPHVKTLTCVRCNEPATEYHHWSYEPEHWLDVIPLCTECHGREHRHD